MDDGSSHRRGDDGGSQQDKIGKTDTVSWPTNKAAVSPLQEGLQQLQQTVPTDEQLPNESATSATVAAAEGDSWFRRFGSLEVSSALASAYSSPLVAHEPQEIDDVLLRLRRTAGTTWGSLADISFLSPWLYNNTLGRTNDSYFSAAAAQAAADASAATEAAAAASGTSFSSSCVNGDEEFAAAAQRRHLLHQREIAASALLASQQHQQQHYLHKEKQNRHQEKDREEQDRSDRSDFRNDINNGNNNNDTNSNQRLLALARQIRHLQLRQEKAEMEWSRRDEILRHEILKRQEQQRMILERSTFRRRNNDPAVPTTDTAAAALDTEAVLEAITSGEEYGTTLSAAYAALMVSHAELRQIVAQRLRMDRLFTSRLLSSQRKLIPSPSTLNGGILFPQQNLLASSMNDSALVGEDRAITVDKARINDGEESDHSRARISQYPREEGKVGAALSGTAAAAAARDSSTLSELSSHSLDEESILRMRLELQQDEGVQQVIMSRRNGQETELYEPFLESQSRLLKEGEDMQWAVYFGGRIGEKGEEEEDYLRKITFAGRGELAQKRGRAEHEDDDAWELSRTNQGVGKRQRTEHEEAAKKGCTRSKEQEMSFPQREIIDLVDSSSEEEMEEKKAKSKTAGGDDENDRGHFDFGNEAEGEPQPGGISTREERKRRRETSSERRYKDECQKEPEGKFGRRDAADGKDELNASTLEDSCGLLNEASSSKGELMDNNSSHQPKSCIPRETHSQPPLICPLPKTATVAPPALHHPSADYLRARGVISSLHEPLGQVQQMHSTKLPSAARKSPVMQGTKNGMNTSPVLHGEGFAKLVGTARKSQHQSETCEPKLIGSLKSGVDSVSRKQTDDGRGATKHKPEGTAIHANISAETPVIVGEEVASSSSTQPKENAIVSSSRQPKENVIVSSSKEPKEKFNASSSRSLQENASASFSRQPPENFTISTSKQPKEYVSALSSRQLQENVSASSSRQPSEYFTVSSSKQPKENVIASSRRPKENAIASSSTQPKENAIASSSSQPTLNAPDIAKRRLSEEEARNDRIQTVLDIQNLINQGIRRHRRLENADIASHAPRERALSDVEKNRLGKLRRKTAIVQAVSARLDEYDRMTKSLKERKVHYPGHGGGIIIANAADFRAVEIRTRNEILQKHAELKRQQHDVAQGNMSFICKERIIAIDERNRMLIKNRRETHARELEQLKRCCMGLVKDAEALYSRTILYCKNEVKEKGTVMLERKRRLGSMKRLRESTSPSVFNEQQRRDNDALKERLRAKREADAEFHALQVEELSHRISRYHQDSELNRLWRELVQDLAVKREQGGNQPFTPSDSLSLMLISLLKKDLHHLERRIDAARCREDSEIFESKKEVNLLEEKDVEGTDDASMALTCAYSTPCA